MSWHDGRKYLGGVAWAIKPLFSGQQAPNQNNQPQEWQLIKFHGTQR